VVDYETLTGLSLMWVPHNISYARVLETYFIAIGECKILARSSDDVNNETNDEITEKME
jgi:hypothetical protein